MVLDSRRRSPEPLKNSAFRKAVVVPAVFALVFSGSALIASPALAIEPVPVATETASPSPSPSETAEPTAEPTAPSTQTPVPTAPPTTEPTAPPTSSVPAVKTLTVTSPKVDTDGTATIHGERIVTVGGTAPIGSKIEVTDPYGSVLGKVTTKTTDFSLVLTFTADDSYYQSLVVSGSFGKQTFDEFFFDVVFDAEKSAAPTITSPVSGSTFTSAPLPFFGAFNNGVLLILGRGTPGDDVFLTSVGDDDQYVLQYEEIVVDDNGDWSGHAYVANGTTRIAATQSLLNADGDNLTIESDQSAPVPVTINAPKGTVDAPYITTPNYEWGDIFSSSAWDSSEGSDSGTDESSEIDDPSISLQSHQSVARSSHKAATSFSAASIPTALLPLAGPRQHHGSAAPLSQPRATSGARDDTATIDEGDDSGESVDDFIDENGIKVTGTPSKTSVGTVDMTVSGTGTPGDGIVLYQEAPTKALAYFAGLYPTLFSGDSEPTVLNDGSPAAIAPAPGSTGDPASTEKLPAYDGTIRVGADGTWTTTLARVPGNYILTSFAVSPAASSNPSYSVASAPRLIHLTGTPSVAVTELAFTGSQVPVAGILGAFGAVGLGAALTLITRRRRSI
jgi:hypothetical protein